MNKIQSSFFIPLLLLALINTSCKHQVKASKEQPVYFYFFEKQTALGVEQSQRLIEQFLGEKGPQTLVKSDENIVYFSSNKDMNTNLEHDLNTGNFTFNRGMTKYLNDFIPQLPTPQEALKIADRFLASNALSPRNSKEFKLLHQGGVRATTVQNGNKPGPIIDKLITLNYGRVIDSLPVLGPGSKMVINIGDKGEVTSLIRRWRELSRLARKKIDLDQQISQEEAQSLARRQIVAEFGTKAKFEISRSFKAYYDNNGQIIQPVYAFETTINLGDQNVQPFNYLCVIPFAKNAPERLNLFVTDPRAKEPIRNYKRGDVTPGGSGNGQKED
jgi:hypothetical protein